MENQVDNFQLKTTIDDDNLSFLRKKSEPIGFVIADNSGQSYLSTNDQSLVGALKKFIRENEALGISAIQLGHAKQIFVMRKPWNSENLLVVINPKISSVRGKSKKPESCFSIPAPDGMYAIVQRPSEINIQYQNENGITIEDFMLGFDARLFLHEYSHLIGKLMTDNHKLGKFIGWRNNA